MSKGLGPTQKQVLAELDAFHEEHGPYENGGPQWIMLHGLLNKLRPDQDPAGREAIRRAVRTLAARALITTGQAGRLTVLQRAGRVGPPRLGEDDEKHVDRILHDLVDRVQRMLVDIGSNRRIRVAAGDYDTVHRVLDLDTGRVHGYPDVG